MKKLLKKFSGGGYDELSEHEPWMSKLEKYTNFRLTYLQF